jgi:hypothetical protein
MEDGHIGAISSWSDIPGTRVAPEGECVCFSFLLRVGSCIRILCETSDVVFVAVSTESFEDPLQNVQIQIHFLFLHMIYNWTYCSILCTAIAAPHQGGSFYWALYSDIFVCAGIPNSVSTSWKDAFHRHCREGVKT